MTTLVTKIYVDLADRRTHEDTKILPSVANPKSPALPPGMVADRAYAARIWTMRRPRTAIDRRPSGACSTGSLQIDEATVLRDLTSRFDREAYAFEELLAEIAPR